MSLKFSAMFFLSVSVAKCAEDGIGCVIGATLSKTKTNALKKYT